MIQRADRIITMGYDVRDVPRIDDDWGLTDPKGQTLERIHEIREMVKAKSEQLWTELQREADFRTLLEKPRLT